MEDLKPITESREGAVLTIALDRAPAHPLSMAMIDALSDAIARAGDDKATRVIILTAPGKVFCAGHDLKEIEAHRADGDRGRGWFEELFARCGAMMQAITDCPKPVIAMVDGIATAAGCQLVAACDLAYASTRAQFCTPGVNTGGFCTTPLVAISRNMHRKHAMEMALSGDMLDAETALSFGLVNRVLAPEALEPFVRDFAQRLAGRAPIAIAQGKRAFYRQLDMPLGEAYAHATRAMVDHFMTKDSEEGKRAFFEGRAPVFRGE